MHRILVAVSAFAAVLVVGSLTRANAAPLGNPAALAGAAEDVAVVDTVHCRPGWRHHNSNRWRRGDGCARDGRRGVVIVAPGRTRYVIRNGIRVRVGADRDVRSRTTIRSERTTIRSGRDNDTQRSGSTTTRSRTTTGTESGNTTNRSGGQGGGNANRSGSEGGGNTTGAGRGSRGGDSSGGGAQRGGGAGQGGGGQAPNQQAPSGGNPQGGGNQ
jgi:hypothetical protein